MGLHNSFWQYSGPFAGLGHSLKHIFQDIRGTRREDDVTPNGGGGGHKEDPPRALEFDVIRDGTRTEALAGFRDPGRAEDGGGDGAEPCEGGIYKPHDPYCKDE